MADQSSERRVPDYIPTDDENSGAAAISRLQEKVRELSSDRDVWKHIAETHELTGLPNRRGFERMLKELQEEIDRDVTGELKKSIAILALDLQGFKRINDIEGHAEGDRFLTLAAHAIAGSIRTQNTQDERPLDQVAVVEDLFEPNEPNGQAVHPHGDEFYVILRNVHSNKDLEKIKVRIQENISAETSRMLASHIGSAMFSDELTTVAQVVKAADKAANEDREYKKQNGQVTR